MAGDPLTIEMASVRIPFPEVFSETKYTAARSVFFHETRISIGF